MRDYTRTSSSSDNCAHLIGSINVIPLLVVGGYGVVVAVTVWSSRKLIFNFRDRQ